MKLEDAVYVLHAFQKKSKSGIETPRQDIEKVRARLKVAEADHVLRRQREGREKQ